jgi:Flp pilus assembly protein TadG
MAANGMRRILQSLTRSRAGVTTLEFAIVAPVFLALTFMIMETGLLMFSQNVLDGATRSAARLIETGQVQTSSSGGGGLFQSALCSAFTSPMLDCGGLVWTVEAGDSFAALTGVGTTVPAQSTFVPGGPGQVVMVRVFYTQASLFPLIGQLISANGSIQLSSTAIFRNGFYQ